MAQTITELAGATRLARAIASDLSLYNMQAIEQGLRDGRPFAGLEDELLEARHLFLRRVAARLDPVALLVRTLEECFGRLAVQHGLPSAGLAEALAARLAHGADRLALRIVGGWHDLGRIIPLGDGVQEIGRLPPADIEILVESIARRHARLTVDGAHVEVEDIESTGGIFVNDEQLRSAPLAVGARLQLGGVGLTLIRVATVEPALEAPQTPGDAFTHHRKAILDALAEALGPGGPQVLVRCDLDHLDRIHAHYGHAVADEMLSTMATRLTAAARAHQGISIGRYGAAFLLMFPGPDATVLEHAEALRVAVTRDPIATREGPIPASLSIGAPLRQDASAPGPEALLERALQAR